MTKSRYIGYSKMAAFATDQGNWAEKGAKTNSFIWDNGDVRGVSLATESRKPVHPYGYTYQKEKYTTTGCGKQQAHFF